MATGVSGWPRTCRGLARLRSSLVKSGVCRHLALAPDVPRGWLGCAAYALKFAAMAHPQIGRAHV